MAGTEEILAAINERAAELGTLAEAARRGDEQDAIVAIGELLRQLLGGLPIVGALLDPALREAFERSAYGRVRHALDDLDAERDEATRRQAIAEAVAGELSAALALIIGQLAAVRRELDARRERAQIRVAQRRVEAGTGVAIGSAAEQDIHVEQDTIAGGTGVTIG